MKFKKILLFMILFLFILLLSNNVKGFVLNDGGVEKYYLPDLPLSDDNLENIFLFNNSTNEMLLLVFPKTYYLGYDRFNNIFVLYNGDGSQVADGFSDLLSFYYCNMDYSGLNLVGTKWVGYMKPNTHGIPANFLYSDYTFVYGTTNLYPCFKDVGIITSLPDGFTWSDNFIIHATSRYISEANIYFVCSNPLDNNLNWFFKYSGRGSTIFYADTYSDTKYSLVAFKYNFLDSSWVLDNSVISDGNSLDTPSAKFIDAGWNYNDGIKFTIFYSNFDLLDNENNIAMNNTNSLFKNLRDDFYNNFPYILNGAEDLAEGNDDIVIMPRGF